MDIKIGNNIYKTMEEVDNIIAFKGEELTIHLHKYAIGHNNRLDLVDSMGMPIITATTNVEHIDLEENEVLIKDYGENEGILKAFKKAGIISNVTERITQGHVTLYICDLLI